MAQWRKSFYGLGTENLADPAVEERQRQQQLAMQQQQLSMERAAQQQSMVQAQQDAALKAMLAQQSMGLSRDRMAQQQAQFEAQQAQIPQSREHEALMAQLQREAQQAQQATRFNQQKELGDIRFDREKGLAKTAREQSLADQKAADKSERAKFKERERARLGEKKQDIERENARDKLRFAREIRRQLIEDAQRAEDRKVAQGDTEWQRRQVEARNTERRNALAEQRTADEKAKAEGKASDMATILVSEFFPDIQKMATLPADERNALFDNLMQKAGALENSNPGIEREVLNMLSENYKQKQWDAPFSVSRVPYEAVSTLTGGGKTDTTIPEVLGGINPLVGAMNLMDTLGLTRGEEARQKELKKLREDALREALGARYGRMFPGQ